MDAAIQILQKREARRQRASAPDPGRRPLYGTPHTVDAQGRPDMRPDLRQAAPGEYPELG